MIIDTKVSIDWFEETDLGQEIILREDKPGKNILAIKVLVRSKIANYNETVPNMFSVGLEIIS